MVERGCVSTTVQGVNGEVRVGSSTCVSGTLYCLFPDTSRLFLPLPYSTQGVMSQINGKGIGPHGPGEVVG